MMVADSVPQIIEPVIREQGSKFIDEGCPDLGMGAGDAAPLPELPEVVE
jgi:hypothetical protein